jgi:dihydroorotase
MPGNMFEAYHQGKIRRKLSKKCVITRLNFQSRKAWLYREGYYADLVIVNSALPWSVKKEVFAKCGWTLKGLHSNPRITHTFEWTISFTIIFGKEIRAGRNVI